MNPLLKFALPKIVDYLFGKSKRFKAIMDYVHKPNSADKRIEYLEAEIKALKKEILEIKKFVKKEIANLKKLIKALKLK